MDITPQLILSAIGLLVVLLSPILAWWGSSKFFEGRLEQWQANSDSWRAFATQRFETLEATMKTLADAAVYRRLNVLEENLAAQIDYVSEMKHLVIDPYIRAVEVLKTRVDYLDKRANEK